MKTFSEEQKLFITESLKSGMGIGKIVDDLIEIYGIEVNEETQERYYRRVQKMKSKVLPKLDSASEKSSEQEPEEDILASVSPEWRLSYLRALLRDAEDDIPLKTRLLREIRTEEDIVRKRRQNRATTARLKPLTFITDIQERMVLRLTILASVSNKLYVNNELSEMLGEDIDVDTFITDLDDRDIEEFEKVGQMFTTDTYADFMTGQMFTMDIYTKRMVDGVSYPGSVLNVKYYDEIEKYEVYQRKCDGVRVSRMGKAITPGEKSHREWLKEENDKLGEELAAEEAKKSI